MFVDVPRPWETHALLQHVTNVRHCLYFRDKPKPEQRNRHGICEHCLDFKACSSVKRATEEAIRRAVREHAKEHARRSRGWTGELTA